MVYGEGVIGKSTARKWFAKFKNSNFDIDDMPRSRRPFEFDKNHLKALLKEESHQISRELAKKIKKQLSIIFIQWDLPKNWKSGCLMSLVKITKKLPSNYFSTPCLPSSNTQSQTALFVPNHHSR